MQLNENAFCDAVLSTGSGAEEWYWRLRENLVYRQPGFEALLQVVCLTCLYFLDIERKSPENLQEGWGGGFDIIYYADDRFHRLTDMSFVFFDVQLNKLDDVWYPQSIFKFSSDGPHLFIHHFNGKNHLFGISMMNDKFGITNFPDTYDYNSNRLCSCVSIYEGDVEIEKVTFINGPNVYGEPVLHSREINGCLVIWFSYRIHGRFETNCTR